MRVWNLNSFSAKSRLVCINLVVLRKLCKKSHCFPRKFTQLAQILHDRRSWRSRQISALQIGLPIKPDRPLQRCLCPPQLPCLSQTWPTTWVLDNHTFVQFSVSVCHLQIPFFNCLPCLQNPHNASLFQSHIPTLVPRPAWSFQDCLTGRCRIRPASAPHPFDLPYSGKQQWQ